MVTGVSVLAIVLSGVPGASATPAQEPPATTTTEPAPTAAPTTTLPAPSPSTPSPSASSPPITAPVTAPDGEDRSASADPAPDGRTEGTGAVIAADEPIDGQYLVTLADGPGSVIERMDAVTAGVEGDVEVLNVYEHALEGFAAEMSPAMAAELSADPAVERVEEDGVVELDVTQPGATWGLDRIDQRDRPLDQSYTYNGTGTGVRAYVIDTGIRTSHSEFGGRASIGTDFVNDGRNGQDCNGHGTHTAGTIGGTTYGVAKEVSLIAVRVFGCSGGTSSSTIIASIDWVTANAIRPAVVNMSLGGALNATTNAALANSVAAGIVYAVSAGNDNGDACTKSPAAAPAALTVAASDSNDARASFSNRGTCVDLFAPGVNITSAWYTSDSATNSISGTSMAAPHVAGVAAQYLGQHPAATPAEVATEMLADTTPDRITNPGTGSPNRLLHNGFVVATPAITVELDARPDAAQDFTFTGCREGVGGGCSTLVLDDDGDPTNPRSATIGSLEPGTYTLTQAAATGWQVVDLDCGDAGTVDLTERRATVVLGADEHVTCTFVDDTASLTVMTDTTPNGPADVAYTACLVGVGCSDLSLDDDNDATLPRARTLTGLVPGQYTITQAQLAGHDLTGLVCDGSSSVDLDERRATITFAGLDDVVCTFSNTARGSMRVAHDSVPDSAQDVTFDLCRVAGDSCPTVGAPVTLDDDDDAALGRESTVAQLIPGEYRLSQRAVAGWGLASVVCGSGDVVDPVARTATITISPGEAASCTFTSRATALTIIQDSTPHDAQDFTFTGCRVGSGCAPFALDDDSDPTVPDRVVAAPIDPGVYTITQAAVDGWGLIGLVCTSGEVDLASRTVTVTVAAGDQLTCRFVNRQTSITIIQDSAPADGQDFTFTHCAPSGCAPFTLDDDDGVDATRADRVTLAGLAPGSHTITQAETRGWGLRADDAAIVCSPTGLTEPSARRATLLLSPGDHRTCTFTTHRTTLTIVQDASPDGPQDFTFTGCRLTACGPFVLDDDEDPVHPDRRSFTALDPGPVVVMQAVPPGWGITDITCDSGDADVGRGYVALLLKPGEQSTCHFTTAHTSITIEQRSTPESPQDFTFTGCIYGTALCGDVALDDDNDPTRPQSGTAEGLAPGMYQVTQQRVPGWGLVDLTCTEGETNLATGTAVLLVEPGDQHHCTWESRATTVTIRLDTQPNSGDDITFTGCRVADNACAPFTLDDDSTATLPSSKVVAGTTPGTYQVTQEPAPGWGLAALTCTAGGSTDLAARRATIVVTAGVDTTCTFTLRDTTQPFIETFPATGLSTLWGITNGPDGNIWVAGNGNDRVGRVDPGTGAVVTFPAGVDGPRHPVGGPDGNIWVSAQTGTRVARINPATGAATTFNLPGVSNPWTLAFDQAGLVWVVGESSDTVHRLDPATGTATSFPMTGMDGVIGITAGPDGNLWVTGRTNDTIGRVNPATGAVTVFPSSGVDEPVSATRGPGGTLWITGRGSYGRVDPATGAVTAFSAPGLSYLATVTSGPDGYLWTVGYSSDAVGRIDPVTGELRVYASTGITSPWGITTSSDGRLWVTGRGNTRLARIVPST